MSEQSKIYHYPSPHVAWLACLSLLLYKVRTEGGYFCPKPRKGKN
jgi:hypothetical protein